MRIKETFLKCKDCKLDGKCSDGFKYICEYFEPSYTTKLKFLPFRIVRKIFLFAERVFLKSLPPRVFVAGPIKDADHLIFLQNIARGLTESRKLILTKVAVFSPFTFFQINISGEPIVFELKDIIFTDLAFLVSSAAMYLISKEYPTTGTVNETYIANLLGIPIFSDRAGLVTYLIRKGYKV